MVSSSTKLPVVARKHAIAEVASYKNHVQTFLVQEVLGKLPPERPLNPSTSYPSRWNHLAQLGTPNSIAWSILPYRHLAMTITIVTHAAFNYIDHPGSSWERIFSCQLHLAGNIIKVHVQKNQLFTMKKDKNGVFQLEEDCPVTQLFPKATASVPELSLSYETSNAVLWP